MEFSVKFEKSEFMYVICYVNDSQNKNLQVEQLFPRLKNSKLIKFLRIVYVLCFLLISI